MLTSEFNGYKVNLIQNVSELRWLRKNFESVSLAGIDTETTGLSFISDKMVGLCVAGFKPIQGFYIPVRHVIGNNLPLDEVVELAQYLISNKKTMFFNRNFDYSMLENDGLIVPYNANSHEVQAMCWMATNEAFPSLKKYCRNFLKWKMIDFGDAAGEDEDGQSNHNFGETDPEQSYIYAAFDPVATVMLGKKMWSEYPYIRKIYPIDNLVTEAVRRMSQTNVCIDFEKVRKTLLDQERRLRELKQQAITMAGFEFNVSSNKDKGEALSRFVTLSVKTKTGAFSVKDEVLQDIEHPLAKILLEYSKTVKYISSYLNVLLRMEGKSIHFNFKVCDVPTGRMASGSSKGNDYYAPINVQSIPKTEAKKFLHKGGDLGFYLDDNEEDSLGKMKVKSGLREAFTCPDDCYFVTADFCLSPKSLIKTLSGDIPLHSLSENTQVITPLGPRRAFNIRNTGKKKKCILRLKTGEEIVCSPDHKFKVIRSGIELWSPLSEILSTDTILTDAILTQL